MTPRETGRADGYQVFMLVLCLYALGALAIERVFQLPPGSDVILRWADYLVCVIFLADFLWSLWRAESRSRYFFTWGWIDLLSSIPVVESLRFGRVARVLRVLRVLRGFRATRLIATFVLDRRAGGVAVAAGLLSALLVVSAAIGILHVEAVSEANIKGPEDAVWWALSTVTTVGYGDRYPVTTEGRILASVLMLAGVGLFGTLSGFVAAWFLAPAAAKERGEIDALREEIAALRRVLEGRPVAEVIDGDPQGGDRKGL